MRQELKALLVCPVTKQHLVPVEQRLKMILEQARDKGSLHYADGALVSGGAVAFLITDNRTTVYSVVEGVPILLENKQVLVPE